MTKHVGHRGPGRHAAAADPGSSAPNRDLRNRRGFCLSPPNGGCSAPSSPRAGAGVQVRRAGRPAIGRHWYRMSRSP